MTQTTQDRVKAGAAFMDQLLPEGWRDRINEQELDIAYDGSCVIGQCCGSFGRVMTHLDVSPEKAVALGFFESTGPKRSRRYNRLTAAWRRELRQPQLTAA